MKAAATKDLFGYWNRLRGARSAPERFDIDPAAIRGALGDVFILEIDALSEFPFRLSGSRICALTGHEMRDERFIDLWSGPDRQTVRGAIESVADEAAVAVIGARGSTELDREVDVEISLLPLRHRGRTHVRLIGALAPVETPYWVGSSPVTRFELTSLRMIWPSGRRRMHDSEAMLAAPPPPPIPPSSGRRIGRFFVFDGGR